jgi:hypothetical protein
MAFLPLTIHPFLEVAMLRLPLLSALALLLALALSGCKDTQQPESTTGPAAAGTGIIIDGQEFIADGSMALRLKEPVITPKTDRSALAAQMRNADPRRNPEMFKIVERVKWDGHSPMDPDKAYRITLEQRLAYGESDNPVLRDIHKWDVATGYYDLLKLMVEYKNRGKPFPDDLFLQKIEQIEQQAIALSGRPAPPKK